MMFWFIFTGWSMLCGVWMALLLSQVWIRRSGRLLSPTVSPPRGDEASVCVIIPARNECETLGQTLHHVLKQDHPPLSVRVVDDRSEDGTGQIVADLAKQHSRLKHLRIDALPPGWLAKSHALWVGTRQVQAQWLLFIDADCTLEPQAVRTAIDEAERRDLDLLTLWPRHLGVGFWEHLLIPLCGGIIALWFSGATIVRSDCGAAFANGQFLLIRRAAYERIGGHRAVRTAIIEDIPLAELARSHGLRTLAAGGALIFGVRMYDGYRAVRDGWARIFAGALRSGTRLLMSVVWLAIGSLLPFIAAPVLIAAAAYAPTTHNLLLTAVCLQHLLLVAMVSYGFWGMGGCRRVYLWLYPLSVVMVMGILLRSWWWLVVRRRIGWRDTSYVIDRRGCIV